VKIEPAKGSIIPQVAGKAESSILDIHGSGNSPRVNIIYRDVAADRHAERGCNNFRYAELIEAAQHTYGG